MDTVSDKTRQNKQHALLEVENVGKTFTSDSGTTVRVLEDVNFRVAEGELLTVVGATGCGKTTLLNLIAGIESTDAGGVRFAEGLSNGKDVAYVFQHYTLFPWRTVCRNLTFGLQMRGIGRAQREATALKILNEVGLRGFEKVYPHELSGGMRQRAAIAQALAPRPRLLLMDEPFGALDDSTRRDLQQILVDIWQRERMTILFVTHNIDEALVLGRRVLVFSPRPGKVAKEFGVGIERPRNRLSKGFTDLFVKVREALSE